MTEFIDETKIGKIDKTKIGNIDEIKIGEIREKKSTELLKIFRNDATMYKFEVVTSPTGTWKFARLVSLGKDMGNYPFDIIHCYNNIDRKRGVLYLGHWNDGC